MHSPDQNPDQSPDQSPDQNPGQSPDQSPGHSPDQSPGHSQAEPHVPTGADARLSAPSARRNAPHIAAALAGHLPQTGTVLEIAAGTGEHAVALARANPGLTWQPTDIAPDRRASIDAWARAERLANIRPAIALDAAAPGWTVEPVDVVYLSNLLHLIAEEAARNVIAGAARALAPGGRLCLYGPFREHGAFRSEGDARFDAQLRAADPQTGYKSVEWVTETATAAGLAPRTRIEMPANNLVLVFARP